MLFMPAPAALPERPLDLPLARRGRLLLRFEDHELDALNFQVRRRGVPLALAPQPFDLLWLLASRAGATVTREEIRRTLWSDRTHVGFDGCTNFSIRVLRKVLDDDARAPRFIASVRGRGYRFLPRVEVWPAPGGPVPAP